MDFNSLPEPWDVKVYYPGTHLWTKPKRCSNIYLHLCGAGGNGGAGQSGTAGTQRGGGGGGTGGVRAVYYGPSIFFDDNLIVVPSTPGAVGSRTIVRFASGLGKSFESSPELTAEFVALNGGAGNPGSAGVGGEPGTTNTESNLNINIPGGIIYQEIRSSFAWQSISSGGRGGYSTTFPTEGVGRDTRGVSGAGGGGIISTYNQNENRGGGITEPGGGGNGLFFLVGNNNYAGAYPGAGEGAAAQDGITAWLRNKYYYISIGGAGGNASNSGTGGKGGNGGIGAGGGGGGAGVTGGAGGAGGPGLVIIASW